MTSPTPDLAELRRLAEAATPGPWHAATGAALQTDAGVDATHVWYCRWRDERFLSISKVLDNELDQTTPEDAAYIAAANPAVVLALLDKLDALAALRAAAEAIARAYRARAECAEGLLVSLANRAAEDRAEIEALRSQLAERDALAARLAAAEVEARAQTERAVHAEKQADHETRVAVHLAGIVSGLRAKIERVRALPAKHPAGGWYMTSMRDVLAALDEEPQP